MAERLAVRTLPLIVTMEMTTRRRMILVMSVNVDRILARSSRGIRISTNRVVGSVNRTDEKRQTHWNDIRIPNGT